MADNPDIASEDNRPVQYLVNDIATMEPLYRIRYKVPQHRKVVEALSIEFGDNTGFLNPSYKGLPLNDSLSNLKPFISYKEEHYLFSFNLLTRNHKYFKELRDLGYIKYVPSYNPGYKSEVILNQKKVTQ